MSTRHKSEKQWRLLLSDSWDLYVQSERYIDRDAEDSDIYDWLKTLYDNCQRGYGILSKLVELGFGDNFGVERVNLEDNRFDTWTKAAVFVNSNNRHFKKDSFVITKKLLEEKKDKSYESNLDIIANHRFSFLNSNLILIKKLYQVVFDELSNLTPKTNLDGNIFLIKQLLTEIGYYILRNAIAEGPCTSSVYMALARDIEIPENRKIKTLTIQKTVENIYFKFGDSRELSRLVYPEDLEIPFQIWDCDTGNYLHQKDVEEKAYWFISKENAKELMIAQERIEKLLSPPLRKKHGDICKQLYEKVLIHTRFSKRLEWSYVKSLELIISQLDRLIFFDVKTTGDQSFDKLLEKLEIAEGKVCFKGTQLGISSGAAQDVLKILKENAGKLCKFKELDNTNDKDCEADASLKKSKSQIEKAFQKAEVPFTIKNVKGEGYRLELREQKRSR